MIPLLVFLGVMAISISQAILSSMRNRGSDYGWQIFSLGIGLSLLWVVLVKYTDNLVRDGLIWDIVIAMSFTITFLLMGHGENFQLKHWIGLAATLAVFFYWAALGYI